MESPNESVSPVTTRAAGVRYGVVLGAISIVLFVTFNLAGMDITDGPGAWINRLLSTGLTIGAIVMAHNFFKQNGDGFMSFGQGIGTEFWCTLTSTSIASVFMYVYIKFIDSAFIDMIKDRQLEEMQKRGMSDEQIEQAMKIAGMFTSAEAILLFGIFGGIFFGVLIALIVTIFTQKKNPDGIPS